jgi:protein-tyrosine phosphatase
MGVIASPRLLPLTGAYNFRDLGGYRTAHGGTTRWKRLYRSDTLHDLTEADLATLSQLGLRTIIDLRSPAELETTGRGPLQDEDIAYLHLSVIQEATSDDPVVLPPLAELDLAFVYLMWLNSSPRAFVEALTTLGRPESYPAVFHCAAGKDRTGVLAALVLDILGVERQTIVEDYALTATRLDAILIRQANDPVTAQRMIDAPQLFTAVSDTMETFLDGLHEQHGGARNWALGSGVPQENLDVLSTTLAGGRDVA